MNAIAGPRISSRRRWIGAGMFTCAALMANAAWSQTAGYPSRPVRMIVSVASGGATDTLARRMADHLARAFGQGVVVENQPAGSGVIAAQTVARAAPDGHTILIGTNTTHAANASFLKSIPYDPVADFEPISLMGIAPLVLCVNNAVPGNNLQEFIAYAKSHPGKINFGAGTGSARLASEMLKAKAGIDLVAVPYKGNAPALTDLRAGQIEMLFGDVALMLPHVRNKAVKALGVSSAQRAASLPDIPTLQEAGVPGYELVGFIAAFAPARTPEHIVRRLNEEMGKVLRDKEFRESLAALGVDAAPSSPAQLRDWVVSETRKWADLARAANIRPE